MFLITHWCSHLLWFTKPLFADWVVWFSQLIIFVYTCTSSIKFYSPPLNCNKYCCALSVVFTTSLHCLVKICIIANQQNSSCISKLAFNSEHEKLPLQKHVIQSFFSRRACNFKIQGTNTIYKCKNVCILKAWIQHKSFPPPFFLSSLPCSAFNYTFFGCLLWSKSWRRHQEQHKTQNVAVAKPNE